MCSPGNAQTTDLPSVITVTWLDIHRYLCRLLRFDSDGGVNPPPVGDKLLPSPRSLERCLVLVALVLGSVEAQLDITFPDANLRA